MKQRGSRFGILYGLCKVHKQLVDNCPLFRSIMSAIKTPTYSIAKFLVPLLELITTNLNNVKNRFKFAGHDPGLFIVSLDAEFLFTNILLEETLNVCCDSLFSNDAKVNNISRIDFEKLLRTALQNNFFLSFSNCWDFVFF